MMRHEEEFLYKLLLNTLNQNIVIKSNKHNQSIDKWIEKDYKYKFAKDKY